MKQRLFSDLLWASNKIPQFAIVNTDDNFGKRIKVSGFAGLWTYGKNEMCDFQFEIHNMDYTLTIFQLRTPFGSFEASVPLCGEFNVYNCVGVIAAAASLGIPVPMSLKALAGFPGVPGRLQRVINAKDIHVFVDYAHSPHALQNVLQILKKLLQKNSQIILLFGCGGNRDKGKRELMAEVAEKYAQKIIVTSDNPREEDPMDIIHDILRGFHQSQPLIEADRKKGIHLALSLAQPGDVVLIAGKGHEDYQIIGKEKFQFSDLQVAKEFLHGPV